MKLFLMRHAHADYGPPDPERTLSAQGQACASGMAAFAAERAFFDFEQIWSSPYARARQTAEPFSIRNGEVLDIELDDTLTPYGEPEVLLKKLAKQERSVLVVGHNPHLSILGQHLLGMDHGFTHLPFKKGALMVFKRDQYSGSGFALQAYVTPASLGL